MKNSYPATIEEKWYSFFESIIFIPPGEVPQTKGHWYDSDQTEAMIKALKEEYPGASLIVVSSRCGEIDAYDADEWMQIRQVAKECAEEEAAYIKAGICADCGACSLKDAEGKCKPSPIGDTGDYSCAGERLWEEDE